MDQTPKNKTAITTLFPDLSEDESERVKEVLEGYAELVYRIFLRVHSEARPNFDVGEGDP